MSSQRPIDDIRIAAHAERLRALDARLARVEQGESDLMAAIDAMRTELGTQVRQLHEAIQADRIYVRDALDAIRATVGKLRESRAHLSGGIALARTTVRLLALAAAALGITIGAVKGWLAAFVAWLAR